MDLVSLITSAAISAGVGPSLLLAICHTETGLRNIHSAQDGRSASYGVCQVKLGTARLVDRHATASSLMRPADNVRYAALYLRRQLERYSGNVYCAIQAYNAGTCRVVRLTPDNSKSYTKYVSKVIGAMQGEPWKKNSRQ